METKPPTAVEWLVQQIEQGKIVIVNSDDSLSIKCFPAIIEQAKEIERQQHGRTWDAAIQAHEERGHVLARSICDFDEYEIH